MTPATGYGVCKTSKCLVAQRMQKETSFCLRPVKSGAYAKYKAKK